MKPKVSVIGSGVLAAAARSKLDENGAFRVIGCDPLATASNGIPTAPSETADSQVLVMPACELRSAEEARDAFFRTLASVVAWSPDSLIVVAGYPSTGLCEIARSVSGLPGRRVIGTGTLPDSWRLRELIAAELRIAADTVEALAIGEPGSSAVPLLRLATISGVPILGLLDADRIRSVLSAFRAPREAEPWLSGGQPWLSSQVAAIERIVTAVGLGQSALIPCTVQLAGEYDLTDVYLSVPAVIGSGGVQRVVELDLSVDELIPLRLQASSGGTVPPMSYNSSLGTALG